MHFIQTACSVLLFALSVAAHTAPSQGPSEMINIMRLEERDAEAAKINDVDALAALWTEDGVLLMPGSDPILGKAAIRQYLEAQRQQSAAVQTVAYDEDWVERRIVGEQAWEWGSISVTMQLPDGRRVSQKAFMVRVLFRQSDGSWRFARAIVTPAPKRTH